MKLKILLLIMLACRHYTLSAQQQAALYAGMEDYNKGECLLAENVEITTRSKNDIKMNGGNDYKIEADDYNIKNDLKRFYWFVKQNDTLYLNMKPIMKSKWYAKALYSDTTYIYFRAGNGEVYNPGRGKVLMASAMFGAIGGGFAAASAAKERYDYILDRRSGNVYLADKTLLLNIVKGKEGLYNQLYKVRSELTQEEIIYYLSNRPATAR